ncbi:hypothetical protein [Lactobacillus equicursoris]|uniref:Uncharacterized protein n=1 Tax=Lactobacillus equicursoris DSM 19284 = JCM 14600 = CIP 110162 TaxID=1293597 RepID=A0A0R1M051_9LACO|nr:hypothetical protein [Lactobacillus equicursoris]KRK99219.1 hypothetical protein FC20_GL001820 [Lactobacillus equicursoris DSM 19284 = JCM 14600 = CIP 110162]
MSNEITKLAIKNLLLTKYVKCKAPNQQLYEDVMNTAFKERRFQSFEKRFEDDSLLISLKHDNVINNESYKAALASLAGKDDWANFLFDKEEIVFYALRFTLKKLISKSSFDLLLSPKFRNSDRLRYQQQALLLILFSQFDRKTVSYSEFVFELREKIDKLIWYYKNKNSLQLELINMAQSNVNFTNAQLEKIVLKTIINDFKN